MNAAVVLGLVLVGGRGPRRRRPDAGRESASSCRCGRGPRQRGQGVIDDSVERIGRPLTALFVAAAGLMLLIFTLWILGVIAHQTQDQVDWPAFRWFRASQVGGSWQNAWNHLTKMGNRRQTQAITVVAAVAMAVAWRVRSPTRIGGRRCSGCPSPTSWRSTGASSSRRWSTAATPDHARHLGLGRLRAADHRLRPDHLPHAAGNQRQPPLAGGGLLAARVPCRSRGL